MKISICNLWSINNAGRPGLNRLYTKYYRPTTNWPSTTVENSLQITPFMQNKANFGKAQMNVNKVLTRDYENIANWKVRKNKANSKPNKANLLNAQMNVKSFLTEDYENISNCTLDENKANTNPIQTQTKPISPSACPFCFSFFSAPPIIRPLKPGILQLLFKIGVCDE